MKSKELDLSGELPFAPRRRRPLSLWNPLDYLVLLYWVFYFPQAIRWYVERFGTAPAGAKVLDVLRQDPVQRRLALQALGLLGLAVLGLVVGLPGLGVQVDPVLALVGMAFGVVLDEPGGLARGL